MLLNQDFRKINVCR